MTLNNLRKTIIMFAYFTIKSNGDDDKNAIIIKLDIKLSTIAAKVISNAPRVLSFLEPGVFRNAYKYSTKKEKSSLKDNKIDCHFKRNIFTLVILDFLPVC